MKRRGFLAAILAAGVAPAVVKAASLMPVRALESGLLVPELGFFEGPTFVVPKGVGRVFVTMYGAGGGGSGGSASANGISGGSGGSGLFVPVPRDGLIRVSVK